MLMNKDIACVNIKQQTKTTKNPITQKTVIHYKPQTDAT